jgi:hypothetical protein
MRKSRKAAIVSVTLGALGCGEPARPPALQARALFAKDRVQAGEAWRRYLSPRELHAAWAPPADSPWRPYHKPTLLAAVAVVQEAAGPTWSREAEAAAAVAARFLAQTDLSGAAVFVDLAGETSVAWGMALLAKGHQPVVTFNNWPHQNGLLKLERPLGALIHHAGRAASERPPSGAPPAFLLERGRLERKDSSPGPDVFDNRWFHAATDFPDAARLRAQKITRVIYVNPKGAVAGDEEDDLNAYFSDLKVGGLRFTYAVPRSEDVLAADVAPLLRRTIFDPVQTAGYASGGSGPYHRPFVHYHHFWSRSSGTWGSGSSGGGWSGFSS